MGFFFQKRRGKRSAVINIINARQPPPIRWTPRVKVTIAFSKRGGDWGISDHSADGLLGCFPDHFNHHVKDFLGRLLLGFQFVSKSLIDGFGHGPPFLNIGGVGFVMGLVGFAGMAYLTTFWGGIYFFDATMDSLKA
jgi:hypothetical protein